MHIALDYTPAVNQGAGIGRYARSLTKALLALDQQNSYTIFYASEGKPTEQAVLTQLQEDCAAHPHCRLSRASLPNRPLTILWHRVHLPASILPIERFTGPIDVFHATDFLAPPQRHGRSIVTVHDVSFLTVPEAADAKLRRFLEVNVPRSLKQASTIIAVSEFTRQELIQRLGIAPERIKVAANGVEKHFQRVENVDTLASVRKRLNLPARFILSVGTLEPRKNLLNLLEAYAILRRDGVTDCKLVIAGRKGWLFEPIFARIAALGLTDEVIFPGFITDESLPALYSDCQVFAYPSLYEGFGLPVAEALACGSVVLTSNNSALPEVAGQAALLANPHDPGDLAQGLERLLTDVQLRQRLKASGPAQVAQFTWSRTAQIVLEAYTHREGI